jgi:hypothetical protein
MVAFFGTPKPDFSDIVLCDDAEAMLTIGALR